MIVVDGYRFFGAHRTIPIPTPPGGDPEKTYFGRVCKPHSRGSVETSYLLDGAPLWAIPIRCKRHRRPNLMVSGDGRLYLFHNQLCFIASSYRAGGNRKKP